MEKAVINDQSTVSVFCSYEEQPVVEDKNSLWEVLRCGF